MNFKSLVGLSVFFFSTFSMAASVSWDLNPMTLRVYAENFQIESVEVWMSCTISDGSGLFSDHSEVQVRTSLTLDPDYAGAGNWYTLQTDAASLRGSKIFAELKSCMASITVVSDLEAYYGTVGEPSLLYREFELALENESPEAVYNFVEQDQAANIEARFSEGLRLRSYEDGRYLWFIEE